MIDLRARVLAPTAVLAVLVPVAHAQESVAPDHDGQARVQRSAQFARGILTFQVGCAKAVSPCTGRARITTARPVTVTTSKGRKVKRKLTLAAADIGTLSPGQRQRFNVRVSLAARRYLSSRSRAAGQGSVKSEDVTTYDPVGIRIVG